MEYGGGLKNARMNRFPPVMALIMSMAFTSGAFLSCASQVPQVRVEASPARIEVFPEVPETLIDRVVRKVKEQSGDIGKYVFVDSGSPITVKADIEGCTVVYDLENIRPRGETGFWVDFLVEDAESGGSRRDSLAWSLGEDAAGILLAFDDDYQAVWEQYFDLFDLYGAKVTFFIIGDFCSFCGKALGRGHDVGYHTRHHLDLRKIPREDFFEEVLSALDSFRQEGVPVSSFAYPYGFWEPWMNEELAAYYTTLRGFGTTFRIYRGEDIRSGYISSKSLDNTIYKNDAEFDRAVDLMFRVVKFIGGDTVLPLTTHTIADDAAWGIKPQRLEYILKTARDLRLKFYRYSDFTPAGG
jgi:peptidoglycan/xylan/chitin deacetylase (PgdA/CDA1 family)